jgi:hypothetical protein
MPWRPAPESSSRPTGRSRALERVVQREHRDLIVLGSSRSGPEGRVRIGGRTRQLLSHSGCALAVAPRGRSEQPAQRLTRIGVGKTRLRGAADELAIERVLDPTRLRGYGGYA